MTFDIETLNRRFGPWASLALGAGSIALFRRGAGFAPVAVAILVLAWTATAAIGTFLRPPAPEATESPWRRRVRAAAGTVVVGLYQNVLFYLLPVWFASATWTSANVAFPVLLAAMALFSCFEYPYRSHVLDRPVACALWSAAILFAAMVPAATVVALAPLRSSVAASAGLASVAAMVTLAPRARLRSPARVVAALVAAAAATAVMTAAAPLLPPVPVVRVASGVGTAVEDRELKGASDAFPAGVPRVYAWIAIGAPERFSHGVCFEWSRDGVPVGRPAEVEVTGGRRDGFRTWAWVTAPPAGKWRVDVLADSGQLLWRERFTVGGASSP